MKTSGNHINLIRRVKYVTFKKFQRTSKKFAKTINMSAAIKGKWVTPFRSIWTMTHFLFCWRLIASSRSTFGFEMKQLSALRF